MNELKPCPKCKTTGDLIYVISTNPNTGKVRYGAQRLVSCHNCYYQEPEETWNKRPIEDALQAQIDEMLNFSNDHGLMKRTKAGLVGLVQHHQQLKNCLDHVIEKMLPRVQPSSFREEIKQSLKEF